MPHNQWVTVAGSFDYTAKVISNVMISVDYITNIMQSLGYTSKGVSLFDYTPKVVLIFDFTIEQCNHLYTCTASSLARHLIQN